MSVSEAVVLLIVEVFMEGSDRYALKISGGLAALTDSRYSSWS
jgi:hypothetical protein